jgi:hypothetical protein
MFGGAQLVMRKAKIVGTSDEIHARLDSLQTMSRMLAFAGEGSQTFTHGSIESFNKGGVQLASSQGRLKQVLRLLKGSQGHLARDLDDAFLLHVFDHGRNTQLRPHHSTSSPPSYRLFDFFAKRTFDAVGIGCPAIGTYQ